MSKKYSMVDATGKILVIVESPNKISKIQHILGDKYVVMASVGHIMDLDDKTLSVDIASNFKPLYSNKSDKENVIKSLRSAAKKAKDVLLATDKDREGEMIAWSLKKILELPYEPKRISFNSITKDELMKAVKSPKKIDDNIVDAQKARRILDRIVGYEISPILWKSIGESLSAGRVQSVVVRLLIDREREINNFFSTDSSYFFKIDGVFLDKKDREFGAQLYELKNKHSDEESEDDDSKNESADDESDEKKGQIAKIKTMETAKEIMESICKSTFKISNITEKDSISQPSAPFTTSTLQQEAARKLGFTVKRTVSAAQKLYHRGVITYIRTDSTVLSDDALKNIKKFVVEEYGKDYHRQLNYVPKKHNTQDAHEAIRPTDIKVKGLAPDDKTTSDEIKLYALIWKRTVASQMMPAKYKIKTVQIDISKTDYYFVANVKTLIFEGYLRVYNVINVDGDKDDDDNTNISDKLEIPKVGTKLANQSVTSTQEYKKPLLRYSEASLINKLDPKNLNIGRPATYESIISKIQERGYVIKKDIDGVEKESSILQWISGDKKIKEITKKIFLGKETSKLVPTHIGMSVTDFLVEHFGNIMDYTFTSDMEEKLDSIEEGNKVWHKVLSEFYKDFHPVVEKLLKENVKVLDKNKRVLGVDEESGNNIIATTKKFGPVVLIESDGKKPLNIGPIKAPLTIDNITLEDAIEILKYPKTLGKYANKQIKLCKGQHGLYLKYGDMNVSLKDVDISDFEEKDEEEQLEIAVKAITDKKEKCAGLWEEKEGKTLYKVLNGPHGRYIKVINGKSDFNVKLPDEEDIEELTLTKVKEIISNRKKYTKFTKSYSKGGGNKKK